MTTKFQKIFSHPSERFQQHIVRHSQCLIKQILSSKTLHAKTDQSIRVIGPKISNTLPRKIVKKSNTISLFQRIIKLYF